MEQACDDGWVEEYVAVEEQYVFTFGCWLCEPEGVDVVGGGIALVVDEGDIECGVATGEEVFDECVEVACDYDELVDAVGYECVEGALE